jgi:hypothetical protein
MKRNWDIRKPREDDNHVVKRVSNLLATPEAKHDVNGGSIKRCTITNLVNFTIWGLADAYLRRKILVNSQDTTLLKIEKQFPIYPFTKEAGVHFFIERKDSGLKRVCRSAHADPIYQLRLLSCI